MTEVERLTRMVDDMTMAAARAAIALLHSFGLSGQQAEDLVNGERPRVHTVVTPIDYDGDVHLIKVVSEPSHTVDEIMIGQSALAHAGQSVYGNGVFQFDRLMPLGKRIDTLQFGNRTYFGVLILQQTDDCTYRCAVDYFKELQ